MGESIAILDSSERRVEYGGSSSSSSLPNGSSSNIEESKFPSQLLPLVPEQSPLAWTVINNTLAISGCLLIIDCLYADKYGTTVEERPFAQAYFLIWEFATCFFWTLETGLSVAYQRYVLHEHSIPWYAKLELLIAIYFLGTTFALLYQWDLMKYESSNVWEISLDTSFYVYMSFRSCRRTPQSESADEAAISLRGLDQSLGNRGDSNESFFQRVDSTGNSMNRLV